MIRKLSGVLNAQELARLATLAGALPFHDGRLTNPDSTVKRNLQVSQTDPASGEPGEILRDALFRHPQIRLFGQPRQLARPTLSRYEPGMAYGWHIDAALFPSTPPIRSDLSCTVFISPPESYEGGELCFELGGEVMMYKLAAGDAILYPSTTIHQVAPVTRGVRLVGVTWLQSWVADAHQRELLVQLEEALAIEHGRGAHPRMQVLLESLRTNLFRLWSDT